MKKLQTYIKDKGLQQKDIATASNLSPQLLSDYLHGRSDISRENFFNLADTLGMSLDRLRELIEE